MVAAAVADVFLLCCLLLLQLEVVHAGVSKVLCNATDPNPDPERKMVGLLGKQQAAAYLTASSDLDASEAYEQPQYFQHTQEQQKQQLEAHLAAGRQSAHPAGAPDTIWELPPEAHSGSAAAHMLLQPPSRVAYTDGGVVPCCDAQDTSGVAAAAAGAALMRHSLDVQTGAYAAEPAGAGSSKGGMSPDTPSSLATGSTSAELPSAVAVIETRSADGKKQVLGVAMEMEGGKGVGTMMQGKQMPLPAFVQLAKLKTEQC